MRNGVWILIFIFCSGSFQLRGVIEHLVPVVVSKFPHDPTAFTQGLAIEEDQLYESTGLYGQSSVRHFNLATKKLMRKRPLSSKFFAEGLAILSHQLFQITWKEHRALVYECPSLKLIKTFIYLGEGWGLCAEGDKLWMSNGTSILTQRDSKTFAVQKSLLVRWAGFPVEYLNDLECVGNHLYANILGKEIIIRIDKETGEVTGVIDASHLLSVQEKACLGIENVLNGIAYRSKTETFFLTGKCWPWIFEVSLAPKKF